MAVLSSPLRASSFAIAGHFIVAAMDRSYSQPAEPKFISDRSMKFLMNTFKITIAAYLHY